MNAEMEIDDLLLDMILAKRLNYAGRSESAQYWRFDAYRLRRHGLTVGAIAKKVGRCKSQVAWKIKELERDLERMKKRNLGAVLMARGLRETISVWC